MPAYAAFLGHQPIISQAELSARVPGFQHPRVLSKQQILLFESTADLDQEFLDTLGGTIVLAKQVSDATLNLNDLHHIVREETKTIDGKVTFSLRCVGLGPKLINKLYHHCKKHLKSFGPVRYVGNERKPVIPVVLHEQKLLDGTGGCELTIIYHANELWIGRTVAAQNADAYTKRDIEKPIRDTETGLLPPKLAQILLNLGQWMVESTTKNMPEHLLVFDPFCGTGVIPIECLLRGWSVLASDLEPGAVEACNTNMEWTYKEYGIRKKDASRNVWQQDARDAFSLKIAPQMIVTETSLGPALKRVPKTNRIEKLRMQNESLQQKFLQNVAENLPGVPIACTWPVWLLPNERFHLQETWESLPKLGFTPVLPEGVDDPQTERTSLLYRRKNQRVGREIILLMPQ